MLKSFAIAAAALAMAAPAGAAFAHDEGYGSSFGHYWNQAQQDRAEHCDYHAQEREAHAMAHWQGFYSSQEHSEWHRNERAAHRAFHDDHQGVRSGGCGWRGSSYGGYGDSRSNGYYGNQNGSYGYDYSY